VDQYVRYLEAVGLIIETIEPHDEVLAQSISDVRGKLLGVELLVKLKKIDLPGGDFEQARLIARSTAAAVQAGNLGYMLMVARRER